VVVCECVVVDVVVCEWVVVDVVVCEWVWDVVDIVVLVLDDSFVKNGKIDAKVVYNLAAAKSLKGVIVYCAGGVYKRPPLSSYSAPKSIPVASAKFSKAA
jgi:hypothetical protein